ncbi:hypothetical protein ACSCBZ_23870 [Streptomyces niveiscabiei]|uniref:Integral membrane protein n=1 Tax=Streptomyces niveiscabiei TaxID=164115 RepID=A0ABW9HYM9_9ACTN
MPRLLKAVTTAAALATAALLLLTLAARVPPGAPLGSVLRAALGVLLANLALGWALYVKRLFAPTRNTSRTPAQRTQSRRSSPRPRSIPGAEIHQVE